MSGLNTSLAIASEALQAQEAGVAVTTNNIANVNTVGYTRETVVLTESTSYQDGSGDLGGGVTLQGYSSVRDELLDVRIQQQTSEQSSADAKTTAYDQIQTSFPASDGGLGTDISTFFTSISALSSNSGTANRQAVISAGQNLADEFNSVSSSLTSEQTSLSQQVASDVSQINDLSAQIATLNNQAQTVAGGGNNGAIKDEISAAELKLSKLTNVSITHTESGADSITTGNGTPLVLGGQSYALSTSTSPGGQTQVLDSSGANITSSITGGDLGGIIEARDVGISGLLTQLDTFAHEFATAINTAQAAGYNENGTAGTALFTVSNTVAGSAATISLATTDPSAIAASSDGSSGSNGNVANLSAVSTTKLALGTTPIDTTASLVGQAGTLVSDATADSTAIQTSLTQLRSQQTSEEGVSVDEESANLIQYQNSYEAAARVVSTISTLFDATINMLGG